MRLKRSGRSLSKNKNDANWVGRIKMKNAANSMGRKEYIFLFNFLFYPFKLVKKS